MTPQEAIRSALDNLAAHKLRSALTMLGMIFGVGAVIAMMSIGAGAQRQALASIERLGLRNVLVRAKSLKDDELQEIRQKSLGVSSRDAAAIAEAVPGVEMVAPRIRIDPYKVLSATGKSDGAAVYGVGASHRDRKERRRRGLRGGGQPPRPGPPERGRGAVPRRHGRGPSRPGVRCRSRR